MSTEGNNNGESSNNRHGCAACKHQRRKCGEDCLLQPYFGLNRTQEFQAAHKIFGISNMNKMMKELQLQDRPRAIDSLVWEASIWKQDPVNGPLGLYKQLQQENAYLKNQVNQLKGLINEVGIVANNDFAINFGDINIVNFYPGRRNLPIAATNSMPLGQDNLEHINNYSFRPRNHVGISFSGGISHEKQEILNQRGNFLGSRPSFDYVAEPENRVSGRDFGFSNYFHNQFSHSSRENNLNRQHVQPMPNPTQPLQSVYNNCIEGQSTYSITEIMEDQALEMKHY